MDDIDKQINDEQIEESVVATPEDQIASEALKDEAGAEAIQAEEEQGDSASIDGEGTPAEGAEPEVESDNTEETVVAEMPENHAGEDGVVSDSETETDNPNAKWYVVHTYSGHENKVATNLRQKIASEHLEAFIFDILVPTQDKIEIRSGKKEAVKEKIFPGYILVKMDLTDNSWLAVRTTPGVTSFVGMGNKPTPIPASEVKSIVKFMTQGAAAPTFKDVFSADDPVKIVDGPFAQFIGKVESVDKEHGKVKVLVSIFGRETPVELDFLQVQKL